ncbi:hypothetical protein Hokovirus_1_48 [Hokovirus HKV1]|uniref:Uncharacterized protein n=1 Tax=Hokovirus HKV1 TaxID=1977638 RepID=A0A1V0SEL9_9VIRU|nr:hypothetical protein Hokovirus_1_48 [Hokovirus HKV1]
MIKQLLILSSLILPIICINAIVIGESGIGKTRLIHNLMDNLIMDYEPNMTTYTKNFNNYNITFYDVSNINNWLDKLIEIDNFNIVLLLSLHKNNINVETIELLKEYFTDDIFLHTQLIIAQGNKITSWHNIYNTFNKINSHCNNYLNNYIIAFDFDNTNYYKDLIINQTINYDSFSLKKLHKQQINIQKNKELQKVEQETIQYLNITNHTKIIYKKTKSIDSKTGFYELFSYSIFSLCISCATMIYNKIKNKNIDAALGLFILCLCWFLILCVLYVNVIVIKK